MNIPKNLNTVLSNIDNHINEVRDDIPLSTSQLINDSDFLDSVNLTNLISGELNPVNVPTENKTTLSGTFIADFKGKTIQKYDLASAVSGSLEIGVSGLPNKSDYDRLGNVSPTVELQIPVIGNVSTISLPSGFNVVDMPTELEYVSGLCTYHDIVLRCEKDFAGRNKIYVNYSYKFNEYEDLTDYLCFTANEDDSSVTFGDADGRSDVPYELPYIEISYDKKSWQPYTFQTTVPLNANEKVYFRGINEYINNNNIGGISRTCKFSGTGSLNVDGDIMTLMNPFEHIDEVPEYGFTSLFFYNTAIRTIPKLTASTVKFSAYRDMFNNCSNLSGTVELPASEVEGWGYYTMFMNTGISGLKINATTMGNYSRGSMLLGCANLTEITVAFTTWSGEMYDWFNSDIPAAGTFKCPSGLEVIYDGQHIPNGWTVVNI